MFAVKRKQRPVNSIVGLHDQGPVQIVIVFEEKKGERKVIQYECKNSDNKAEILAKLKYLLKDKFKKQDRTPKP